MVLSGEHSVGKLPTGRAKALAPSVGFFMEGEFVCQLVCILVYLVVVKPL